MHQVLVIGCGSTLRGDDAAGLRAAEEVARRFPAVRCLAVHQLTPELAQDVSGASTVVFIDADASARELAVSILEPGGEWPSRSHSASPSSLLALAHELYGRAPSRALLVGIPAVAFELSEHLSGATAAAVEEAVAWIGLLLEG